MLPIRSSGPQLRLRNISLYICFYNWIQVAQYLGQQEDIARLAPLFLKDEVDGAALLLLNLPSMLDHWHLRLGEGVSLAKHVESIKMAFYSQFAFKHGDDEGQQFASES